MPELRLAETGRLSATAGARHFFAESANPRAAGSCVKCGRQHSDSVHAYMDLAHQAAVEAHLSMALNAVRAGDMGEAARQARTAARLAEEN